MKMEKLICERFREHPSDCVIDSHALMLRGGYMKPVAHGIFSLTTPLRRITRKIENIIREEMDALGGQEVLLPVVLPASLWQQSGRYDSVGSELLRLKDRGGSELLLGMTHEEAAVHLVREYGESYAKYPFMIYQLQTKFRDEARPRAGLIRVREFTMKDAYSFHTSQRDLERFYDLCLEAYKRIFTRVGLPEVISVESDSGIMGGSVSHEFMLITPAGEDSIAICGQCGHAVNAQSSGGGAQKTAGACPRCGSAQTYVSRGIEVGNIFQLGDKYTKSMDMRYRDADGSAKNPLMGCYGIGVGRLAASVCEVRHDSRGPIWPMAVAPWQVHICCLRADEPGTRAHADALYSELLARNIEVICDDRPVRAGVMFSDADLLGVPLRVVFSPRNTEEDVCEIESRDKSVCMKITADSAADALVKLVREMV